MNAMSGAESFQKDIPNFDPASDKTHSVAEVAKMLEKTPETVRDWIAAGRLKAFKVGGVGLWRIRHDELIKFANTQFGNH